MRSATESYGSYEIGYKWLLGMHEDLKAMSYDELNNIGIADDHLEHSVSELEIMSNRKEVYSFKKEQIMEIATKLPSAITELRKLILNQDDCDEYGERILNVIEACSDPKKYWCMGYKRGALRVLYNTAAELPTQD
ncbi:hypothetical protein ACHAXN_007044 [Cyclotella atomus]